uniref:Uncharacterized protein n=5 Tax=Rhizobium/Agrobacterium group TaxID=227290 RepID=A0A2Z2PIY8_RHIRH|nr:hypothetical protein [Rhizobium rhizogenes]ASK42121.1 hypothetical protein [Rhizobium rhizogenes]
MVPGRADGIKDERLTPKFQARSCGPIQKFGSPTRRLRRSLSRSLTPPSRPALRARLSRTQGDEIMTIEQHIEELRAELNNACDAAERRQIEGELELARAELAVQLAEQVGTIKAEPPF